MPDILPPDNNPPWNAHARSVASSNWAVVVPLYRIALEPPDESEKPSRVAMAANECIKAASSAGSNDHPIELGKETTFVLLSSWEPIADTEDEKNEKDPSIGNAGHNSFLYMDDGHS